MPNLTSTTFTSGKTLYALWKPQQYSVSYQMDGGTFEHGENAIYSTASSSMYQQLNPTRVTYNGTSGYANTYFRVENPTKKGARFLGWSISGMDKTNHSYWYGSERIFNDDKIDLSKISENPLNIISFRNLRSTEGTVTFLALWEEGSYNVIYDANGGEETGSGSITVVKFDQLWSTATGSFFSKKGYSLESWNTEADGNGTKYALNTPQGSWKNDNNLMLYAIWKANIYGITFEPNGGILSGDVFGAYSGNVNSCTLNVEYDSTTNNHVGIAEKEGYIFKGWYSAPNGGKPIYDSNGMAIACDYWDNNKEAARWHSTNNATVYAQWEKKPVVLSAPILEKVESVESGVSITWKKVKDAAQYNIYRAEKQKGSKYSSYKKVATTAKTNYTDDSVQFNKTYAYKVVAIKEEYKSAMSAPLTVKHIVKKPKIKKLKAKAKKSYTILKISIKGKKYDGYIAYIAKKSKKAKSGKALKVVRVSKNKTDLMVLGLKKGKYYVKIRAYKKSGNKMIYSKYSKAKKVKVKKK
jgi:hypothetical protein